MTTQQNNAELLLIFLYAVLFQESAQGCQIDFSNAAILSSLQSTCVHNYTLLTQSCYPGILLHLILDILFYRPHLCLQAVWLDCISFMILKMDGMKITQSWGPVSSVLDGHSCNAHL